MGTASAHATLAVEGASAETTIPEIAGFAVLRTIASGGNADVHLYRQLSPQREVAVKVLREPARTPQARRAVAAEADAMARLSSHPNIVTIYDHGIADDGRPHLVMEYYPLPPLSAQLRRSPFSVPRALTIGIQLASAVATAHQAGILHRDIKPSNVLINAYDLPGLSDFGLATLGGTDHGVGGVSLPWAPPEALLGDGRHDERSDVYSLAATVWAMLTGSSPFASATDPSADSLIERILSAPLPALPRADAPAALVDALHRALSKSRAERTPSALQFAHDLQDVQRGIGATVTPVQLPDASVDTAPADLDDPESADSTVVRTMPGWPVTIDDDPVQVHAVPEPVIPVSEPRDHVRAPRRARPLAVAAAITVGALALWGVGDAVLNTGDPRPPGVQRVAADVLPPSTLQLDDRGTEVILSWDDPNDGRVRYGLLGGDPYQQLLPVGATSTTVAGIDPATGVCFRIVAIRGMTDWSQASPQACARDGAPVTTPAPAPVQDEGPRPSASGLPAAAVTPSPPAPGRGRSVESIRTATDPATGFPVPAPGVALAPTEAPSPPTPTAAPAHPVVPSEGPAPASPSATPENSPPGTTGNSTAAGDQGEPSATDPGTAPVDGATTPGDTAPIEPVGADVPDAAAPDAQTAPVDGELPAVPGDTSPVGGEVPAMTGPETVPAAEPGTVDVPAL